MSSETSTLLPSSQNGRALVYTAENGRSTATLSDAEERRTDDVEGETPVPKSYFLFIFPMTIGTFMSAMDGTIVASSYAAIGSDLNQLQKTSWVATAYLLTVLSFQPLYGKLSDIFGRKSCLLFCYVVFGTGLLFCGLARNMNELIASRAFSGIGGGGMTTVVTIIMSDVIPLRSRGKYQSLINIVWALGNAIGASAGGYIADTIGWRWSFLLQVPLVIIAIVTVSFALHLPQMEPSDLKIKFKRVDFAGAVSLVLTVFFLLFGLDRGGNVSWNDRLTIGSMFAFVVLGITFAVVETKYAKEPIAPKRIIVNSSLIAGYLVNLFGIGLAVGHLYYVALYLQAVLLKSATETSLWLIANTVSGMTASIIIGIAVHRTGKYYAFSVSSYLSVALGGLCVVLSSGVITKSAIGLGIGLVLANSGNGAGLLTALISTIANAGPADQSLATAASHLFRGTGSVVSVSIGNSIIQGTLRSTLRKRLSGQDVDEITKRVRESLTYIDTLDPNTRAIVRDSYAQSLQAAFWFLAFLGACAFVSSLFIKEKGLSR